MMHSFHTSGFSPERREELILEHLGQVQLIARRIHERLPGHVPLDDLISTGVIGLALWLGALGLLMKGGRGWCNTLCPAGAVQGLFAHLGGRFAWTYRVRADEGKCAGCGACAKTCPVRAIDPAEPGRLDSHTCNACLDCVTNCPSGALAYRKGES